jgi:hypothetical protein
MTWCIGTADPKACIAFGTGLTKVCVAAEDETFTIKSLDKSGRQKRSGGDRFEVILKAIGPDGRPAQGLRIEFCS